jgi:predicted MFS family arabinose efflux permease
LNASTQSPPGSFPVALIFWGAVGMMLHVGLARFTYGVMLPSLRRDLGLDYFASGSLNAIHLGGYLIGTLLAPSFGRRMVAWRMARAAHLIVVAGALACALAPSGATSGFAVLAFGRLATGVGAGLAIVATFIIVFEAVSATRRPLVSAVVWSGLNVGIIGSGLLVAPLLESAIGWRVAFAFTALVATVLAVAFPPTDMRAERVGDTGSISESGRFEKIRSARWLFLCFAYLCFGIGYVAYSTFAGVRLAAIDASYFIVGATWTALGITSMIGSFASIPLLNSAQAKRLALAAALLCGAIGSLIASGNSSAAALIGALLVGLGLAAVPTIVSAYARDRADASTYPRAFSIASAFLGIGQLIGPLAGGAAGDWFGSGAIPVFSATAYSIGAFAAVADAAVMRRR